tara:strand:+ start:903 stop:1280 length:378 start_codon:yes stop_codon:yes gene_type:complete
MTRQDQINDIMDRFKFEKVHEAMVALNWVWFNRETNDSAVPEPYELRQRARMLLTQVAVVAENSLEIGRDEWSVATGGFEAISAKKDNDTGKHETQCIIKRPIYLHLSFQLDHCSNSIGYTKKEL